MAFGADAFALNQANQRQNHDLAIEPYADVVNIPDIELELVGPRNRVAAIDLRPAGQSWFDFVPPRLFRRVAVEVLHQQRTRTDQAHIAFKNVEEFGQLIKARGAQESAEARQPLAVGQQATARVACISHRAKL